MRKILLSSLVAAMAFATTAEAQVSGTNIAASANGGSVLSYSSFRESTPNEGTPAEKMIDGNTETDMSTKGQTDTPNPWVIFDLGNTYTISQVAVYQRDNYAASFTVYGTSEEALAKAADQSSNEGWTVVATGSTAANWSWAEITLSNTTDAFQFLKLYANELNGTAETYGMGIREFQVAGTLKIDYTPVLTTINAVASQTSVYTGQNITLSATLLDQKGKNIAGTATWSIVDGDATLEGNTLTATTTTTVTVKATSGSVESNNVVVNFVEDVALQGTIVASAGFKTPANAIDGNWSNAAGGDNDPTQGYLTIDLGSNYSLTAVTLEWNKDAYAKDYTVDLATKLDGPYTTVAQETNKDSWETGELPKEYTFEAQEARFIRLAYTSLRNDGWGAQVREIAAKGTKVTHDDARLSSVVVSAGAAAAYVGDEVSVAALFNDQYGASIEVTNVEWNVTPAGASVADGKFVATAAGDYTISVTADGVTSNEVTISVTIDPNIAKGATVTITNEDGSTKSGASITDGNVTSYDEVKPVPNDDTEAKVASVVVNLGGHYDLTSIEVYLGEFYPTLFSVAVSADGENYTTVLADQEVSENNAHFNINTTAEKVQYIKLLPIKCNNDYKATRIYEIKAFGTLSADDALAHTTVAGVDVYSGVYVEANFDTNSTSAEIDLTAVASLPDAIPATANANALVYVAASAPAALRAQNNVVTVNGDNYTIKNLVVEDGQPLTFTVASAISVEQGTVKRTIAAGNIAAIYLPFGIKNEGAVMTYYPAGKLETRDDVTVLGFNTNGADEVLGAYVPAVLVAQSDITELHSAGAFTLQVKEGPFESQLTASRDFQILSGSEIEGGYGLRESQGVFVKLGSSNSVKPFHSYIVPQDAPVKNVVLNLAGIVTSVDAASLSTNANTNAPIYNLAGQRVNAAVKGIYVIGGKKVVK